MGTFVDECVAAVPAECRGDYQLWVRVDSVGYPAMSWRRPNANHAVFSVTVRGDERVKQAVQALATGPATTWCRRWGRIGGGRGAVPLRRP